MKIASKIVEALRCKLRYMMFQYMDLLVYYLYDASRFGLLLYEDRLIAFVTNIKVQVAVDVKGSTCLALVSNSLHQIYCSLLISLPTLLHFGRMIRTGCLYACLLLMQEAIYKPMSPPSNYAPIKPLCRYH